MLTGQVGDLSKFLGFHFMEPVYYTPGPETGFPSETEEKASWWVGVFEDVGHGMTHKILTKDSLMVIPRSAIRIAAVVGKNNLRLDLAGREDARPQAYRFH